MSEKELSELTDEELLVLAKKMKSSAVTTAVFIGFLIGIVLYSVFANTIGFFTLIPLYFIYKLVNKPSQQEKDVKKLLKERNLE